MVQESVEFRRLLRTSYKKDILKELLNTKEALIRSEGSKEALQTEILNLVEEVSKKNQYNYEMTTKVNTLNASLSVLADSKDYYSDEFDKTLSELADIRQSKASYKALFYFTFIGLVAIATIVIKGAILV